jgi:hypothetical protein
VTENSKELPTLEELPIRDGIIERALQALNSWEITPEQVADLFSEDPVLTLIVLREANRKEGRNTCTIEDAVKVLNRDRLMDLLQRSTNQCGELSKDLQKALRGFQRKSHLTAKTAKMISQLVAGEYGASALTCATLLYVGEILALTSLGNRLAFIAQSQTTQRNLRQETLNQLDFSMSQAESAFLTGIGIPADIHPLTPSALAEADDKTRLTAAICMASVEIVESFLSGIPGSSTPHSQQSNSAVEQLIPDKSQRDELLATVTKALVAINGNSPPSKEPKKVKAVPPPGKIRREDIDTTVEYDVECSTPVMIVSPDGSRQIQGIAPPEMPQLPDRQLEEILKETTTIVETTADASELLTRVMDKLVQTVFQRCALIEIVNDERVAFAIKMRGDDLAGAEEVEFYSDLSPLARQSSTVQSFASDPKDCSPFGSKAFALAPLDAKHDRPIALYADCGQDVILNLAARTIFRSVIECLNEKLPLASGKFPPSNQE